MARFTTTGLAELEKRMIAAGQLKNQELSTAMLMAGAEQVRQAWVQAAEKHNHVLSRQMRDSIDYAKTPTTVGDVQSVDIYPQGRDSRGVRNMEKAAWTHYGQNNSAAALKRRKGRVVKEKAGTYWIDDAERNSEQTAVAAMEQAFDNYLKRKGL